MKVESQLKARRIYRPERFGRTKKRRVLNTESAEDTESTQRRRGERRQGRTKRRGVLTTEDTEGTERGRRGRKERDAVES